VIAGTLAADAVIARRRGVSGTDAEIGTDETAAGFLGLPPFSLVHLPARQAACRNR